MVDETLGLAEEAALHAVRADRARSRHSLAEVHVDGRARGRLDALQLTRRRDVESLQTPPHNQLAPRRDIHVETLQTAQANKLGPRRDIEELHVQTPPDNQFCYPLVKMLT